jgi:enoyl-CoA hydratase/carnithine racemase
MVRSTWFRRLAVAVAAIAGSTAYFGMPEHLLTGADFLSPLCDANAAGSTRQADLQIRLTAIGRRIAYKEQLVAGLVERRYQLDEVAREFAHVIAEDEDFQNVLRAKYPGRTDEVRAALNVIDYVRCHLVPGSEQASAIAHLQGEFRRLYPSQ